MGPSSEVGTLTVKPEAKVAWPSFASPGMRFMAGVPMKPATKRLAGARYTSSGVPTCCITPSFITATRSPKVMASSWSWVTYTLVVCNSLCKRRNSERVWLRILASRLDKGSSNKKHAGSRTMARPRATRCCCPPDIAPGFRFSSSSIPSIFAVSAIRRSRSALGTLRSRKAKAMFSFALLCGYSA